MTKDILIKRAMNALTNAICFMEENKIKLFIKAYGEYIVIAEILEDFFDYEHDNAELCELFTQCGKIYDSLKLGGGNNET